MSISLCNIFSISAYTFTPHTPANVPVKKDVYVEELTE